MVINKKIERIFFIDLDDTVSLCNPYYVKVIDEAIKYGCGKAVELFGYDYAELYTKFHQEYKKIHTNHYYRPFNKYNFPQELVDVTTTVVPEFTSYSDIAIEVRRHLFSLGMSVYDVNPEPIEGAIESLRELGEYGRVIIFTLGDIEVQMKKVSYLGLADLDVEVVHHKVTEMYHYMKYKYPAKEYFMVGDNFVRDVQPALEAGFEHVYHIAKGVTSNVVETKSVGADSLEYKEVGDLKTAIEDHISGHITRQHLAHLMYELG